MSDMARNRLSWKWLLGISILAVVSILACWLQSRPTEPRDSTSSPGDASKHEESTSVSPGFAEPDVSNSGQTLTPQVADREKHPNSLGKASTPLRTTVREGPIPYKSWQTAEGVQVHIPGGMETNVPQIELSFCLRNVEGEEKPFEVGIVGLRRQGGRMLNNFGVDGTGLRLAVGNAEKGGKMLRIGDTYTVVNVPVACSFVVPDIPSGTVHQISLIVKDKEREKAEQKGKAGLDEYLKDISIEILDHRRQEPDIEPFFVTYANDKVFRSEPVTARPDSFSVEGIHLGGELAINLRSSGHVWCYIRSVNTTNVVFPGEGQLVVDPQALRSVTFEFEDSKQFEKVITLALYFDEDARVPLFWERIKRRRATSSTAVNIQALPGVYDLRGMVQGVTGPSLPLGKIRISDSEERIVIPKKR